MADLDITGRVRVDASQAEGEFRRLGGAADRMSRDIGASSGRAGRSIDSIGAGASQSAEQLTRSQARIRDEIARTTTQIQQLGKTASQKFEIKIAAQGLDPAQFAPYLRRLREVEAAQASQAAGAVRAAQSTAASSAAMARASGAAGELGNALRGLAAAYGVGQLISQTDQYTKFTAQLRLASSSTSDYANSLASVRSISTQSQQDIGAVGVLYARVANSTRELGVSQKQVGDIVKSVALSLSVSGATAAESASAILQLSQSFASGTLRGEEFNAVNEAAPRLMKALAEGMGVPIGKLKEMASEGLITSAVLAQALPKALGELNEEAKEVTTISGAFTVFNNELMQFVGASAKSSGAVKLITDSIVSLSENLNVLAAGGIGVVVAKVSAAIGGLAIKTTEGAAAALAAANAAGVQRAALIASAQAEVASAAATSSRLTVTNAMLAVSRQEAAASLASANATAAQATAQIAAARAAGAQSFALAVLAEGEVALLAAQQARSASMAELALLGQQQARVSAQITAATLAQTAAQAGLTAANAAGGAAASLATRALGFLGGPIGIITTLLGFAATAWVLWGSSAKKGEAEATGAVESSTGEIITALDRQISKLKERNALARAGLPEIAKGASEASQRLGELQVQLDNLQSGKGPTGGAALPEAARVAVLQATLREYGTLAGKIKEADAQQRSLDDFGKTAKAGEWLKKYATNSEKLTEELAQARKELGDAFSPEIEKRIRAQYDTKDAGAKKAAAAAKQEQSQYDKLIASIKTKIAQNDEEVKGGEKLNDAQKLGAKLAAEIAQGTRTMTAARLADAKAQLALLSTSERLLEIFKAQQKFEGERDKEGAKIAADIAKINEKAQALEDEAAAYGMGAEALAEMTIARLHLNKADIAGFDNSADRIAQIDTEIAALQRMGAAKDSIEALKIGTKTDETLRAAESLNAQYAEEAQMLQVSAEQRTKIVAQRKIELDYAKKVAEINASPLSDDRRASEIAKLRAAKQLEMNAATNKAMQEEWGATVKQYDDIFRQGFADMLNKGEDGWKAFTKSLKTTFKTTVADQIYKMFAQPFVVKIAASLLGITGGGLAQAATGGGGGVGDIISTASNAYNMLNKGVSSGIEAGFSKFATSSAGQSLGLSSAGVAGNNPSAFVGPQLTATGSQMGAALGVVGNTLAGYAMGSMAKSLISGGYSVSGGMETLQKVGTAVGSALGGPVVGAIVGGAAGVVNRLFGRKLKDSGIEGNFGGASGFEGNSYQYLKGGLFRSDKTKRGELDDGLQDYLSQSFKLLQTQTGAFAETLGLQSDKVASFTSAIKLSLKDLDEKAATAALEGAVKQAGNDLAQTVLGGNTFAKAGEEASATLARLALSLSSTNGWLDTLGLALKESSLASASASSNFIELFGSMDTFNTSMASYYENFYTDAEKTANVTRDVAAALADVGLQMPTTRDEFRALVEAQMALGDSGTGAVAALLGVSGAFASVTAASETAADAAARLADEQGKAAEAAARAAEEAARRAEEIARERYGLETQIMQLLGNTTALRERELEALDASNQSLQNRIWAIEDAKAAEDAARGAIDTAFSALERAVSAEKDAINKQLQAQQDGYQAQIEAAQEAANTIKSIASALASAVKSTQIDSDSFSFQRLQNARTTIGGAASTGNLQYAGLEDALGVAGQDSKKFYGRFEDYAFDQGVLAGNVGKLNEQAQGQLTTAEKTLQALKDQMRASSESARAQLSALDAQLLEQKNLVDAALGIDNSVLSVKAAIDGLQGAIAGLAAAQAASAIAKAKGSAAVAGGGGGGAVAWTGGDGGSGGGVPLPEPTGVASNSFVRQRLLDAVANGTTVNMAQLEAWAKESAKAYNRESGNYEDANYLSSVDYLQVVYDSASRGGLTQAQLDSALGLTPGSVSQWATDRNMYQLEVGTPEPLTTPSAAQQTYSQSDISNAINTTLGQGASVADILNAGAVNFGLTEQEIREAARAAGIPGFARGGYHIGGLRIVGENGPELEATGASRIWNAADTQRMLSAGGNGDMVAELRALRAEVAELKATNAAIAGHTAATHRQLVRIAPNDIVQTEVAA